MSEAQQNDDIIICRVTAWYYRRMALLAALMLVMGLYFLYDGIKGYPSENKIAVEKQHFESVQREYDEAKTKGDDTLKIWIASAKEKGFVHDLESPPRWDAYAAERNWPSNPELHGAESIAQQFQFSYALLIGTGICGALVLLNLNKKFTGCADHMVMPDGKVVLFSDVFKVDKRKWDDKGLAYAYHRSAAGAPEQRVILDDLKFGGAGKVLARLMDNFRGELIEKVKDNVEPPPADEPRVA